MFLLVLIAHNIQNKNVEVWKSGERLKSNNSVTNSHLIKMPFAAKKLDGLADREKGWFVLNHPLILFCRFSAFPLIFCCLKAHIHKETHYILGRVGQKHRDPMELVHMIGGIDTVCRSKGAEHLNRQLQIDNVNDLVAVKSELPPGHAHNESILLAILTVPKHRRFKILVKRIVRRCAVCIEAVFKKLLFCHRRGPHNYAAAFALIFSITLLIPNQIEMSVNTSTILPLSVNGGS